MLYQYLFPTIFLVAFWTVYRQERFPLALHIGQLLTVTILGSACFGFASGIVNERERGIWRRYKVLPVAPVSILAGTMVTRYLLLMTAGFLQLVLASLAGMPMPAHPLALWLTFTISAIAFMGVGLDLAMLAGNVPAVQALGQCVFLPMLIVGGVAVPLSSLPGWAQHLSAFMPGTYAVQAMQACVTGNGEVGFDALVLVLIGVMGAAAGLLAFRWDTRQRPNAWIALALFGWLLAGAASELTFIR